MRHLLTKIIYRHATSTGTWYDFALLPGTGSLTAETSDSDNGPVVHYELEAFIRRLQRTGSASIDTGLTIIATFDDGLQARLGTRERPVRVETRDSDNITLTASWEDIP